MAGAMAEYLNVEQRDRLHRPAAEDTVGEFMNSPVIVIACHEWKE